VYNNSFEHRFNASDLVEKAKMMDIDDTMLSHLETGDFTGFIKIGCAYADAVVNAGKTEHDSLNTILNEIAEHKLDLDEAETNVSERYFNIYTQLAS
jgi:starch synthase